MKFRLNQRVKLLQSFGDRTAGMTGKVTMKMVLDSGDAVVVTWDSDGLRDLFKSRELNLLERVSK